MAAALHGPIERKDQSLKTETEGNSRFMLIFIGSTTIFTALVYVTGSWHNLALIQKVDAILFIAVLVVCPIREIFYFRKGRHPMGPYGGLIVGYLFTLLALTSLVSP